MAVKDLINAGIGFGPGSTKFIITRGLSIAAVANIGALSENLRVRFMTKIRSTVSLTTERNVLSRTKKREVKP